MAYIYESDVGRLGGNLQKTVGYLLSLHKAEYEWNLLGIKVVGHVDALPIPDGTYEYGDAYTVGTAAPYDMWIYTRADAFHSEAYWFNIGKFPAPGPQGPKGDGIGQVQLFQEGLTTDLTYDTSVGCKNNSISSMTYVDSTTGKRLTQNFQMTSRVPFTPGKYINMDATSDNKKVEIKIDESQLKRDYYKIIRGDTANVPAYSPTSGVIILPYSYQNSGNSLVRRGLSGEAKFTYGIFERWHSLESGNILTFDNLYRQCGDGRGSIVIDKTSTDKGTITMERLAIFQNNPQVMIEYNNQTYYRMDPMSAPDGTLNYVHIDSLQDGNGGYKATGKCFSITVSTRAWQVVDIDFINKATYTHFITITDNVTGTIIKLTVNNQKSQAMTLDDLQPYVRAPGDQGYPCNAIIKTTSTDTGNYQPGYFSWETGASTIYVLDIGTTRKTYTPNQLTIIDHLIANI